jgi:hypothetical protein
MKHLNCDIGFRDHVALLGALKPHPTEGALTRYGSEKGASAATKSVIASGSWKITHLMKRFPSLTAVAAAAAAAVRHCEEC